MTGGRVRLALVTGAGSAFGRGLVASLLETGWAVRALDDGARSDRAPQAGRGGAVEWVAATPGDAECLAKAMAGVDVVFHLGALSACAAGDGFDDPVGSHVAVAEGTLALLEAARAVKVRRVVYASSWQAAEPGTPHAVQLLAGELYCGLYHRLHALEAVSLRYPAGLSESDAIGSIRRAADAEEGLGAVVVPGEGRP
jgi:UDP-glucose 4-epimerase